MNINELDSYRLGDAVKFNDKLNPKLWGSNEHLHPQCVGSIRLRDQLLPDGTVHIAAAAARALQRKQVLPA